MINPEGDGSPVRSLAPGELHVWCIPLEQNDECMHRLYGLLQADERQRTERLVNHDARRRMTVARAALRTILAQYVPEPAGGLAFAYGPHGKPALKDWPAMGFNLSHTRSLALCAVALHRAVGVDIEYRRRLVDADAVARRFFAAEEYAVYASLPPGQRAAGFFNAWTRKEAFIKAIGDGLSRPLGEFLVTLRPGNVPRLLTIKTAPQETNRWTLLDVPCPSGYSAALAIDGVPAAVRHWSWPDDLRP